MAVDVIAGDTEMFIEETYTVKNGGGAPNTVSGDICEAAKSKCHRLVNVLFTARLEVQSGLEVLKGFPPCQSSSGSETDLASSTPVHPGQLTVHAPTSPSRHSLGGGPGHCCPPPCPLGSEDAGEATPCG